MKFSWIVQDFWYGIPVLGRGFLAGVLGALVGALLLGAVFGSVGEIVGGVIGAGALVYLATRGG